MDAINLLKNDHEKVRQLLSQLTEEEAAGQREKLLQQLSMELEAHTAIEEEIFYPAFRKAGEKDEDVKMYFEAMEEHRAAGDLVLPDLKSTQPDSEKFSGRAKVLKELVEHHAQEEEKEMFPRAQKLLDREQLEQLGAQMEARKQELLGKMH
ncbi:MAG TPA: hemerythrin domain-containing protein [Lysobacter sp.]|nr:hemerythrin domain-containing protein [Lysobacter sp.]